MAREPKHETAHEPESSPSDQAFDMAHMFVAHLGKLAEWARGFHLQPRWVRAPGDVVGRNLAPHLPADWQRWGGTFGMAFIAWLDLADLLTPEVRAEVRRIYEQPQGAPAIKLGEMKPAFTWIEAVADELGVSFRNTVYAGLRHPLERELDRMVEETRVSAATQQVAKGEDAESLGWRAICAALTTKDPHWTVRARLGIKTQGDGRDMMMKEWKALEPGRAASAITGLRFDGIDFDDLLVRLQREAKVVSAAAGKPSAPTPTVSPEMMERIAERAAAKAVEAVEAAGARYDDDAKPTYPTMRDLASEAGISDDTFRRVRDAAQIKVKLKGAAARNRRYTPIEVDRLKAAALAGNFLERTSMARKWALWGSKTDASKPHASK